MNSILVNPARASAGFTLIELLLALAISAIIFSALAGIVGQALSTRDVVHENNDLAKQAHFAMQRMTRAIENTRLLMLPMNDDSATNWPENIREQMLPPIAPIGDSTLATAVLAVTLPTYSDLDGNGIADADNDGDGRIDEDLPSDMTNDSYSGIRSIDDDGDGKIDEAVTANDDEQLFVADEDAINGLDDDGDFTIDEDASADMNADGCSGVCGVDDDGDGSVDESSSGDDDEDGATDEDWYDPVVFFLIGSDLIERIPVPWDENGDSRIDGQDVIEQAVANNVTHFRVERVLQGNGRELLVDITLAVTGPVSGEIVSLNTRVRVGGGQ